MSCGGVQTCYTNSNYKMGIVYVSTSLWKRDEDRVAVEEFRTGEKSFEALYKNIHHIAFYSIGLLSSARR